MAIRIENRMMLRIKTISIRLLCLRLKLERVNIQAVTSMIIPIMEIEKPSGKEGCVVNKLRKIPVRVNRIPVIFNGESRCLVMGGGLSTNNASHD
jgi:hypothetical protein